MKRNGTSGLVRLGRRYYVALLYPARMGKLRAACGSVLAIRSRGRGSEEFVNAINLVQVTFSIIYKQAVPE